MDSWDMFADDIAETLVMRGIIMEEDYETVTEIILNAMERWEGDV